MSTGGFDGSQYRREVLTPLRERNPAEVEDLFWLAHIPRELDEGPAIVARLRDTKGFLNKERSRQRQAAIATAVLKEWPRIEEVLTNTGSRRALRERLGAAPQASTAGAPPTRRRSTRIEDPAARRRRQVRTNLAELARIRADPDLAHDLFAFLGLPTSATRPMIEQRLTKVGEVNRKRRPDRERTLVDELLVQARELLVAGDPASYVASFSDDARDAVIDALLAGDVNAAAAAHQRAAEQHVGDDAICSGLREPAARSTTVVPVSALHLGTWCAVCGAISPLGEHACTACSATLSLACARCRTVAAVDVVDCASCGASLQPARVPLLAHREEQRAETAALAQVDAAPEAERQALLVRLAAQHPQWSRLRRRIANAPPRAPEHVHVSVVGGEARLAWPQSGEPGVDGYLVERHDGVSSRVLGRTAMTAWSDAQGPGPNVSWTVRALRGEAAASVPTTATPVRQAAGMHGALSDVHARAGIPVELFWTAPPGAKLVVERIEHRPTGDVRRTLSVDATGYRDRHVGRGRSYEYWISVAGSSAAPLVLRLTAGSGTHVESGAAPRRPPARPVPSRRPRPVPAPPGPVPEPHRPPRPSASRSAPAITPPAASAIDGVVAVREADGRLRVTWRWPSGITEAYVAYGGTPPGAVGVQGRKITNTRYELDGGALLDDVSRGAHIAVFAGRRDASGTLHWSETQARARTVAP